MAATPEPTGQGPILEPSDILGVVQRTLLELHGYCGQAPQHVNRDECMKALEKMAHWLGYFPPLPAPPAHANDADSKRRAN